MNRRHDMQTRTGPTTVAAEVAKLTASLVPAGHCPVCWSAGRSLWDSSCMCNGAVKFLPNPCPKLP